MTHVASEWRRMCAYTLLEFSIFLYLSILKGASSSARVHTELPIFFVSRRKDEFKSGEKKTEGKKTLPRY